jgi:hypothetical protein
LFRIDQKSPEYPTACQSWNIPKQVRIGQNRPKKQEQARTSQKTKSRPDWTRTDQNKPANTHKFQQIKLKYVRLKGNMYFTDDY